MANLTKYASFTVADAEESEQELARMSSADFYKFLSGKNVVRFLPGKLGEKWCVLVQQHFINIPGQQKAVVFACPRVHAKRPCPACLKVDKLLEEGNEQAASKYRPSLRVFANIVARHAPESGVQIIGFGKQIHEQLLAIRKNEEGGGDFTDPGPEGFDIVIEKTGQGMQTEYKVLPARKASPLGSDEWLASMHDLKRYGRVESEEALAGKLGGTSSRGGGGGRAGAGTSAATRGRTAVDDAMDTDD